MPYAFEVENWRIALETMEDVLRLDKKLADSAETLERLRRLMGGSLPTDGTYDVSFIDGGELVRQINEGLDVCARDIHRRGQIEEPRQVSVTIKAIPSENSSAVKFKGEISIKLAKSEVNGVAFLDKDGSLQPPDKTTVDQIMMPMAEKAA